MRGLVEHFSVITHAYHSRIWKKNESFMTKSSILGLLLTSSKWYVLSELLSIAITIYNDCAGKEWRAGNDFEKWKLNWLILFPALKLGEVCLQDKSCKHFDKNTYCAAVDEYTMQCQCRANFYPSTTVESISRTSICIPGISITVIKNQ